MFAVDLFDETGNPVTHRFKLTPARYAAKARGGYRRAEITVVGDETGLWDCLNWLRYYVRIRNEQSVVVWYGVVVQVHVRSGALTVGKNMEKMANRVAVKYTEEQADGASVDKITAWAQDDRSVARYGQRELKLSDGDTTAAKAEAQRDTELAKRKYPSVTIDIGDVGDASAALICSGLYDMLDWEYYEDTTGVIRNEDSDMEHLLGWSVTAGEIGFRDGRVHDILCRLGNWIPDNQVVVTGSSYNNKTLTVDGPGDGQTKTYTANTIHFEPQDDIIDSANGLAIFESGEMVSVIGSGQAINNGYRWVKTEGAAYIEVTPATIVNDTPAGNVTIQQGHSAPVAESLTQEGAGASLTITTLGQKLATSFIAPTPGWLAKEILIRVRKMGAPSDGVRVALYTNNAGVPGSSVASVTVNGADISTTADWVTFLFTSGVTLSAGGTYWIVVDRTGSFSHGDVYAVGMDSELGFANGGVKVWNGSAWVDRTPNADLSFQIWGHEQTSTIVKRVLDSASFITSTMINDASSVYERFYREGDETAMAEADRLLDSGTVTGQRLLVSITPERTAHIYVPDDKQVLNYRLDTAGKLYDANGSLLPMGYLPAGKWINLTGLPVTWGALASISPFFVEEAEYDVQTEQLRLYSQNDAPGDE